MMKKLMTFFILITLLISPLQAFGAPSGFDGGVNNEYQYEEIVFITGKSMKFSAEFKISDGERGDTETIKYT